MKTINFNIAMPKAYTDKDSKPHYALPKSGQSMMQNSLDYAYSLVDPSMDKMGLPWLQVFTTGNRVTTENIDWSKWNGVTFTDIDSKHFYNEVHSFKVNMVHDLIISMGENLYPSNFYGIQISNSGTSYHVFWYWDCERTHENFLKCSMLSQRYIKEIFYSMGDQGKQIIDYKGVLDNCSSSVYQGIYMTKNAIAYSSHYKDDEFGQCDINDVNLSDVLATSNVVENHSGIDQSSTCTFISKEEVKRDSIEYYPHVHRRCIYEALVRLFKDRSRVDSEWDYISSMLPEGNGHDNRFYLNEPTKNHWFERYSNEHIHSLHWLLPFGYQFRDDSEYIYIKGFTSSWHSYVKNLIFSTLMTTEHYKELKDNYAQKKIDKYQSQLISTYGKLNASDVRQFAKKSEEYKKEYDEEMRKSMNSGNLDVLSSSIIINCTDEEKDVIINLQKDYYKTRWEAKDFKHLVGHYSIPQDITTYKMYADFYYRDEDNLPLLKYDEMEGEIQVKSTSTTTNEKIWHTFKFGDEYTHWKNNDTFSNKCTKNDLLDSVSKYARRWHTYNSIHEYFKGLDLSKADPEKLETWAQRYFNCDDTKLTRHICRSFFIAAVKKQMMDNPSIFVYPHILFLQGPTGCGKTFFLTKMFTFEGRQLILSKVSPEDPDNKIGPLIAKNMLVMFGEGATLKKTDSNTQKEFVDRLNSVMKYQKKYENEQTTVYPIVMIARTSNEDVLFNDVSINEGDRRNLLLVCKCEANHCDGKLRDLIESEKDVLWATAYKLYLDNPDQDLQLSSEDFAELNRVQDQYKLIKEDDTIDLYNSIFERKYFMNDKGQIVDEVAFNKMVERSEELLDNIECNVGNNYNHKSYINRIPSKWVNNYITPVRDKK